MKFEISVNTVAVEEATIQFRTNPVIITQANFVAYYLNYMAEKENTMIIYATL